MANEVRKTGGTGAVKKALDLVKGTNTNKPKSKGTRTAKPERTFKWEVKNKNGGKKPVVKTLTRTKDNYEVQQAQIRNQELKSQMKSVRVIKRKRTDGSTAYTFFVEKK